MIGVIYNSYIEEAYLYARWLKEELVLDINEISIVRNHYLRQSEIVIIITGLYLGYIPVVDFLVSKWSILKDKTVILMAVNPGMEENPWAEEAYQKMPKEIREKINFFNMPGENEALMREKLQEVMQFIGVKAKF